MSRKREAWDSGCRAVDSTAQLVFGSTHKLHMKPHKKMMKVPHPALTQDLTGEQGSAGPIFKASAVCAWGRPLWNRAAGHCSWSLFIFSRVPFQLLELYTVRLSASLLTESVPTPVLVFCLSLLYQQHAQPLSRAAEPQTTQNSAKVEISTLLHLLLGNVIYYIWKVYSNIKITACFK